MSILKDTFLAILSLDAYNRGYDAGIEGLGGQGTVIGNVTIGKSAESALLQGAAQAADFYGLAYTVNANGTQIAGLTAGTTIISYRGIKYFTEALAPIDIALGITVTWNYGDMIPIA